MKIKDFAGFAIHFAEGGYCDARETAGHNCWHLANNGYSSQGRAVAAICKEIDKNFAGYVADQIFVVYQDQNTKRFYYVVSA